MSAQNWKVIGTIVFLVILAFFAVIFMGFHSKFKGDE